MFYNWFLGFWQAIIIIKRKLWMQQKLHIFRQRIKNVLYKLYSCSLSATLAKWNSLQNSKIKFLTLYLTCYDNIRLKIFFLAFVLNHFEEDKNTRTLIYLIKKIIWGKFVKRKLLIIIILNYYKLHISKDVDIKSPKNFHKMIFFNRDIIFFVSVIL